jgi:4a-hydroxytetrahydrobiopterin dehydratase
MQGKDRHTMQARKLDEQEITNRLKELKAWKLEKGKLHRAFEAKDFIAAFGYMTRIALVAQEMNHHPEWCNVWNKITVDLSTHSVGGVSNLDFELAAKIDQIFSS